LISPYIRYFLHHLLSFVFIIQNQSGADRREKGFNINHGALFNS